MREYITKYVALNKGQLTEGIEGIKRAQAEGKYKGRVPKAMQQADKVKALVAAGVDRLKIQEQLAMSKASYYRCLKN
jgi:DNA invertase Pin-like site-specific DNA recombinase